MAQAIRQGSVWLADLAEGYERPCVVVSRADLNRGRLVMVVPCSATDVADKARFPNNAFLPAGAGGLPRDSVALTHLAQPVEVASLRELYGQLTQEEFACVLHALAWTVDLFEEN